MLNLELALYSIWMKTIKKLHHSVHLSCPDQSDIESIYAIIVKYKTHGNMVAQLVALSSNELQAVIALCSRH